ncbi:MAG: RagB/SusD family nutrient uptake outer membrane protein, partial [Marinoscillum sp.]
RARAGVAPLTNNLATTYNLDILEEIRRERAVELFLENSRYNDLKRWGIAEQELNAPILGAIVEGTLYEDDPSLYDPSVYIYGEQKVENGTGSLLNATVIDPASNRDFNRKDYLRPLPTAQLNLNRSLTQNPGW